MTAWLRLQCCELVELWSRILTALARRGLS
jgi:hypothetical protein